MFFEKCYVLQKRVKAQCSDLLIEKKVKAILQIMELIAEIG
jgi:hypothetical protein